MLVTGGDDTLLPAVEEEILGFTHMEVGEALLRHWNLPLSVVTVVGNHHQPVRIKDYRLETAIMHLASILSLGELDGIAVDETLDMIEPVVWELTSLQPEVIEQILESTPQKVNEVVGVVLSPRISAKQNHP
jgi:HD-like signal output (HDOD) protein